ncbi:helix-turn-helix transcriptional regulator [Actinosynnema sp. NPDC050436]|uniref:helix-turn-helix domain-containing protein n=1 Tax=Actinosynnema sp. NPDC050436 TaxID=3155659 RepID=UPI0033F1D674
MIRSTAKAMALGAKIRAAREAAGLTQRVVCRRTGIHPGTMTRHESGERPPGEPAVAAILDAIGVTGADREEILDLARDEPATGSTWVAVSLPEQRAQLEALVQIEQLATDVVDVSPLVVPGLLQVSGYARAIMRGGAVPEHEIATRVAIRMGRRDILTRARPVRYRAFIAEHVLHQRFGDPADQAEQLAHLLAMARLPHVELRVFRLDSAWNDAMDGPFSLLTLGEGETIIQLENRVSTVFAQEKADVERFQLAVERLGAVCLSAGETVGLITRYAEERKTADEPSSVA